MLLDRKRFREAEAGLGRILGSLLGGGTVAHYTGDEPDLLRRRALQGVSVTKITEYPDHLSLAFQVSTMKHRYLVIHKQDVLHWGVVARGSLPTPVRGKVDRAFGTVMYGPLGAVLQEAGDAKRGGKPVIGITYRVGAAEHAVFLEFPLKSRYPKVHSFFNECLPGKLRENTIEG